MKHRPICAETAKGSICIDPFGFIRTFMWPGKPNQPSRAEARPPLARLPRHIYQTTLIIVRL